MYLKSLLPWMYKNPQNIGYCITLEEILMTIRSPDIKQPSGNVPRVLI